MELFCSFWTFQDSTASENSSADSLSCAKPGKSPEVQRKVLTMLETTQECSIKNTQSNYTLSAQGQDEPSSSSTVSKSNSLNAIPTTSETETQPAPKETTKLPVDIDDHNRTMVLQVDRTDLRLISPDRKVILLHKHHRDVTTCVQGLANSEHFGFICKEGQNINAYIGYVFKCESQSVAGDAVQGQ